jgi:hypothetical protein
VSCPPSRKAALLHAGVEEGVFHLVYTPILPLSSPDQDILKSKPLESGVMEGLDFDRRGEKTTSVFLCPSVKLREMPKLFCFFFLSESKVEKV